MWARQSARKTANTGAPSVKPLARAMQTHPCAVSAAKVDGAVPAFAAARRSFRRRTADAANVKVLRLRGPRRSGAGSCFGAICR